MRGFREEWSQYLLDVLALALGAVRGLAVLRQGLDAVKNMLAIVAAIFVSGHTDLRFHPKMAGGQPLAFEAMLAMPNLRGFGDRRPSPRVCKRGGCTSLCL